MGENIESDYDVTKRNLNSYSKHVKKEKIVLGMGTVKWDLHDNGKNIVGMMLEGAGFELVDLGVDAVPEKFLAAVREHQPDILCMRVLLTTTMPNMFHPLKGYGKPVFVPKLR